MTDLPSPIPGIVLWEKPIALPWSGRLGTFVSPTGRNLLEKQSMGKPEENRRDFLRISKTLIS